MGPEGEEREREKEILCECEREREREREVRLLRGSGRMRLDRYSSVSTVAAVFVCVVWGEKGGRRE